MSRTADDRLERFRKMKEGPKQSDIGLYFLRWRASEPRTFLEAKYPNYAAELASVYRVTPRKKIP